MADLLAAGSLLLTVITILYSLWYQEIVEASKREIDALAENRKDDYEECRRIFRWKMLPLCCASAALFLINLPIALQIVLSAVQSLSEGHSVSCGTEDAVKATFAVVVGVLLFLLCHTLGSALGLAFHVWKLDPRRGNYKLGAAN
jgi:hypothetical protein